MRRKILLIDDDNVLLNITKEILQKSGFDVVTLSDPKETEKYIEKEKPDLLIIDIIMPNRSGFDILNDFKERNIYQDIPKIFLTGLDDSAEKIIARMGGVKNYITKPLNKEDLIGAIEQCLGRN